MKLDNNLANFSVVIKKEGFGKPIDDSAEQFTLQQIESVKNVTGVFNKVSEIVKR